MDTQFDRHHRLRPGDAAHDEQGLVRLYVAGHGPRAEEAWQAVRMACEHIRGKRLDVELVDVSERPDAARGAGVLFTPTLVQVRPGPERRWVGDFSTMAAVTRALAAEDA